MIATLKNIWNFFFDGSEGDYACDPAYKESYDRWLKEKEKRLMPKNDFLMKIDDVFRIYGKGTVIIGKLQTNIKVGDHVEIFATTEPVKAIIIGIETFNESHESAPAGMECGLLLRNIKEYMGVARGDAVFLKGTYDTN